MAHPKYTLNPQAFKNLDTPEKRYWYGFVLADGYVGKKYRSFKLLLEKGDKNHIVKFRNFIGSNHPITTGEHNGGKYAAISFSRKKFCLRLKSLGIKNNKSHIAKVPNILKKDKHFWRGMFDGDGVFCKSERGQWYTGMVGTESVVTDWSNFCERYTGQPMTVRPHYNIKQARYGGIILCQKIADVLYKESNIYLDRKYKLYKELQQIETDGRHLRGLTKECRLKLNLPLKN